jgi:Ni,Fe-hydrogenase III small subunit/formate hydrogenlyase subunit 6/NADH:ubiquinone oxidoreductase subunit I
MLKILRARRHQGHRTMAFPEGPAPSLPERFRGRPEIDAGRCRDGCRACSEACPTATIRIEDGVHLDLGRCLFCDECRLACPEGAFLHGNDYRLAARNREDLRLGPEDLLQGSASTRLAAALEEKTRRLLGRSLKLRVVSAGGCGACEADTNVLTTIGWDIGRFGIQYVASPRHADGLIVTGPVTANMRLALRKTYDAVPTPRVVIAVGACAISGGPYREQREQVGGADVDLPVDLYIPGCPPHPLTILDGMLRFLGRKVP